jgi:hypothetical protein
MSRCPQRKRAAASRRTRTRREGACRPVALRRHHTAVLAPRPAPPMRRRDVADIGDAWIAVLAFQAKMGEGMPQRAAVSSRPSGWFRTIVGIRKDAGHRRQIARPVAHGASEFADRLLALRYRIDIAQRPVLLIAACRACGRRHRRARPRSQAVRLLAMPPWAMLSARSGRAARWE